jgi:hypothetical protein
MKKLLIIVCMLFATQANAGGWGFGGTSGVGVPYAGAANDVNITPYTLIAPTVAGSTASGGSLLLQSTTNATKGTITGAGLVLDGATFANTLNVGKTTTGVADLLLNPAVKASGNLLDLQVAGVSKFKVDMNGTIISLSGLSIPAAHGNVLNDLIITSSYAPSGTAQQVAPIQLNTTYNQPSATSVKNTDIFSNRIETNLGTTPGVQRLIDLQVSNTSMFGVSNKGQVNYGAVLFAALGTPANGTFAYCSDCTVSTPATCTANLLSSCTCAGSGTGALAKRLNGAWYCN